MNYSSFKPRRRKSSWWWLVFVVLFVVTLGKLFLLYLDYPWRNTFGTDSTPPKINRFSTSWPVSLLTEEKAEQKRIRKYAKGERQRRQDKHQKRMENLREIVVDILRDPATLIEKNHGLTNNENHRMFLWPWVSTELRLSSPTGPGKPVSYLAFPMNAGTVKFTEGVVLDPGEEIRFGFPIQNDKIPEKYYLLAEIFPQTPGTLRVVSGTTVQVHSFMETQVNQENTILVPLGESTAGTGKLVCVSTRSFVGNLQVVKISKNGRLPLQVYKQSELFQPDNQALPLVVTHNTVEEPASEMVTSEVETPDLEPSTSSETAETSELGSNEPKAGATPSESSSGSEKSASTSSLSEEEDRQKAIKIPPYVKPKDVAELGLILSSQYRENRQVLKSDPGTVALGYNVVFLHLGTLSAEIVKSKKIRSRIMPGLHFTMENSVGFLPDSTQKKSKGDEFTEALWNPINPSSDLGLLEMFRKYGYKTSLFTSHDSLGLGKGISADPHLRQIRKRWQEGEDWKVTDARKEFDTRNDNSTGLEAIFKQNRESSNKPFSQQDLNSLYGFVEAVSGQSALSGLNFGNETFVTQEGRQYLPNVLEQFQIWLKKNTSSRFMAGLKLDVTEENVPAATQDFLKLFKLFDVSLLLNSQKVKDYTRSVVLDRTLAQVHEALIARSVEHRTIIVTLADLDDHSQIFLVQVPGLLPKSPSTLVSNTSLTSLLSFVPSLVGLGKDTGRIEEPAFLRTPPQKPTLARRDEERGQAHPSEKGIREYHLLFGRPAKKCDWMMEWVAKKGSQLMDWSQTVPLVEPVGDDVLVFYPCSLVQASGRVIWRQKFQKKEDDDELGGSFQLKVTQPLLKDLPILFLGRKLIQYDWKIFSSLALEKNYLKLASQGDDYLLQNQFEINLDKYLSEKLSVSGKSESEEPKMLFFWLTPEVEKGTKNL